MEQVFCVFEVTNSKVLLVHGFDSKDQADSMCDSLNNFSIGLPCRFIVRCLDGFEYDSIIMFLDNDFNKDISSIYDPFIDKEFMCAYLNF